MTNRLVSAAIRVLADRGFVVTRHPAVRRQRVLRTAGVDLVLDVGGASGAYGAELRHFGYTGTILSVEPLGDAFDKLRSRAADDPHWHVENCAVGEVEGEAVIHVASNSDSSSLLPPDDRHRQAAPHVTFEETRTVAVRRLDDVAAAHLRPDTRALFKIDAQGFEREVMAGARRCLELSSVVQLELSFTSLYEGGMLVDEAVSLLYADGYELVGLVPGFAGPDGHVLQADGLFLRADR
ncbi:FkbM family methyltransferase [Nocardioides albidus]|uniref:FkbM family methyltransferase n=1 Tax=Nocardioides albidus TaxID=1517589 RepID=UPI0013053C35|nr:FkbM family methyltransferase [Nocardioides albidus]